MQKKLIALALASLAGTAFAQSNVTIYGVADVSFESASAGGAAAGASRGSYTRVSSNSSLIGFKGSEALGNGLTAVFQYESGIAWDTAGAIGGGRDTYVGLAGGFGTVVAGNVTGPTRALGAANDMNTGATTPGANSSLIGKPVGGSGSGVFDTRLANTVAYISPNFSGFSAVIGYSSGENKTLDNAAAAAKMNLKAYDLGLNYANGPIAVGYAHGEVRAGTDDTFAGAIASTTTGNAVALNTWKNDRLAGSYTFGGGHKVSLLWDKANVNLAAGADAKRTTWGLGGKFMVSANGGLIAQYYKANKLKLTGAEVADSGAALWELGYEHSLSKRTMLKASYATIKNQAAATYDFNIGAIGGGIGAGADPKVLGLGVRHSF